MRRIIVGTIDGRSDVLSDGVPPRSGPLTHTPGFELTLVWSTGSTPKVAERIDPTPSTTSFLPAHGETRCIHFTIPPSGDGAPSADEAQSAADEFLRRMPGLAELFDEEGMQTTPTVDYAVILEGELCLILDEAEVTLTPGDLVVLLGARHAWQNRGQSPVRMVGIQIGAEA